MSKAHLHVLDTQTGVWHPVTSTGVSGGLGGGGARASHQDWAYAAVSGGIVNTSDVTLVAAGGANTVNYLTALQLRNADASVATEVVIKSGSTVLWRTDLPTNSDQLSVVFPQPLRADNNTALTAAAITTAAEVYLNAQGYTDADATRVDAEYGTDAVELYTVDGARVMAADGTTFINGA
jgi:hypothetical protein